ncbi:SCO6745 family protein [Bounagaea algeriensis]
MTKIARRAASALQAPHSMIYFAPEAEEAFAELGLGRGRMAYYAGRAAAMGPVDPGVVAATFYNFNPESVARAIPRAWSIASPETIIATRYRTAEAALTRIAGADTLAEPWIAEAADLAERAARACPVAGKPLFAGHADVAWPEQPAMRLWHAITLLREFRGDAHVAALQQARLDGLSALVLHSCTGKGFKPSAAKSLREWSDEQWEAALEELRERGLVDADGEITEAGAQLREEVEAHTDAMSMPPWEAIGTDATETLSGHAERLSRLVSEAGGIPLGLFGRD